MIAAAPAAAVPLLFSFSGQSLTGPVVASFRLDSNPTPDRINDQSVFGLGQVFFDNVPGVFNGVVEVAPTISFGTGLASQFQISGSSAGFAQFGGQTVFTGTLAHPVFSAGTYRFNGFSSGTLTVADVPEPASWAMMVGGFGLLGVTLRQRRRAFV
ncbi:MAG: PEPxxWA-CTERM sorting domain-containing protein [Janthinobacterium lividum]